ncbi:hypothetical protein [Planktothricoides sp. SR001]|uniref:hypothetical protein n=1 Tax=Planktothricoides sp. SR001 TaxID=1705388 RepID=UPI000AB104F3|nr:hypothetical protein [Planktothricoides sp. SR001]
MKIFKKTENNLFFMLIDKIIQELEDIPAENLTEIYDFIHNFRLRLNSDNPQTLTVSEVEPRTPGILPGKLGDAFFEPLPEEKI